MRFLIDQSLPYRTAGELRNRGFEAVHARDEGLARAPDEEILEWCRANDRIAVSADSDFPTLVVLARATRPSVIRLFAQGLSATEVADAVVHVAAIHAALLESGALVTIRRHMIAVRELPVRPFGENL